MSDITANHIKQHFGFYFIFPPLFKLQYSIMLADHGNIYFKIVTKLKIKNIYFIVEIIEDKKNYFVFVASQ